MTAQKPPLSPDLAALASEACDLWQEHLAAFASDPGAKAELMRLMEPSRRLFAEWAAVMQHGSHGAHGKNGSGFSPAGATTARTASDANADDVAQLSRHVAALEKRLALLESGSGGKAGAASGQKNKRKS